ncbi:MAG: hypothetical protein U1E78_08485 [Gammaproteobacteria bacterium]
MESGPQKNTSTTTSSPSTTDHSNFQQSIPWPKVGAAVVSVGTEQALFYPLDTLVKNALHSAESKKAFLTEIRSHSLFGAVGRSYQGLLEAYKKKGIQRGQKWFFQDTANQWLKNNHKAYFEAAYGPYANVVMSGVAGGFTGLMEPLFVQYFDTKQVRKQLAKKGEIHGKLSFRDGYRATFFTGIARNLPGSVGLFGGSELFNNLLDNPDKSNPYLNFSAKLGGAGISAIVSQPGDVIKTKMQKEFVSAREAIRKTTFKEMMTNGFGPRVALNSVKVAFGFFVYEQMVKSIERFFSGSLTSSKPSTSNHGTAVLSEQQISELHQNLDKLSIASGTTDPQPTEAARGYLKGWEHTQKFVDEELGDFSNQAGENPKPCSTPNQRLL